MSALDWLRSKAKQTDQHILTVSQEAADATEAEAGAYLVTMYHFRGTLPVRMALELRKGADLVRTDTETETLRIGGQYRSQIGQCEYFRTTYEKVGA